MKHSRLVRILATGAALTLVPIAFGTADSFYPQAMAGSSNAGGNGKGGGQGNSGNGNSGESNGNRGNGNSVAGLSKETGKSHSGIRPNDLGRLNAFLNASSNALKKAAPNSAIGILASQYAGALSTYVDAVNGGQLPAPTLDDAAALLARAANKPLSPDIVAAINARLAAENPDIPSLAGLADPANAAVNDQLALDLSDLANTLQDSEANQGLGPIY